MSDGTVTNWRFLVIEDNQDITKQLVEACPGFVAPDSAQVEVCLNFKEAVPLLDSQRYDLLIIDLKDDSSKLPEEENLPGLKVYEEVKKRRFVPIVFYTALPKYVLPEQNAFVRVVEKTSGLNKLRDEVRHLMGTQLPNLTRHLENEQREYMWDFVSTHWKEFTTPRDQADLAYLLARRLALSLESLATKLAVSVGGSLESPSDQLKAHPMVMYIRPPLGPHRLAGDILSEKANDVVNHWIVLTPSCDFAQEKAKHAVLAKCEKLSDQHEFKTWSAEPGNPSKSAIEDMEKLIRDNRKGQQERFKFLPGTFFLPDLLVDFQQLRSVPVETLNTFEPIATLDSPYAEALLARFARYFGRLGTPDVDENVVLNRLQAGLAAAPAGKAIPPAISETKKQA